MRHYIPLAHEIKMEKIIKFVAKYGLKCTRHKQMKEMHQSPTAVVLLIVRHYNINTISWWTPAKRGRNVEIDIKRITINKTNNKDGLLKLFLFLNRVILKYSSKVTISNIILEHFYVAGRIKYKYYFFTACLIKTNRTTSFHLVKKKVFVRRRNIFYR